MCEKECIWVASVVMCMYVRENACIWVPGVALCMWNPLWWAAGSRHGRRSRRSEHAGVRVYVSARRGGQ